MLVAIALFLHGFALINVKINLFFPNYLSCQVSVYETF